MENSGNIFFCGVGGQGILLASEITAHSLLATGLDVKKSEVHGMAQRGGSVEAHLRFGKKIYSPLIEPGTVDIMVAFEQLEAVRYLPYLHKNSRVIVNTQKIPPPAVATGKIVYPDDSLSLLEERGLAVVPVDGFVLAEEAGEIRAANVVLVGAMSIFLPIPEETFVEVIEKRVPARFREANMNAFEKGRRAGEK